MPQILRARICNFRYNHGLRAIVDETYDFADLSGNPSNALINLANGGGKSVLTQVLLQPVLPRAKVAHRKIESYFSRTQDPAFIALEWALENGNRRMVTGIVIAASATSANQDDGSGEERVGAIKYYTFHATYYSPLDPYSITNLPFCEWDGPCFKPSPFDRIRNESKKSKGRLSYFSSDDRTQWQRLLSDYGIEQEAWKTIESLNIEEGGVLKLFGELDTSDKLIDRFILKRIVNRDVSGSTNKDDSSLKTMMKAYVKQYNEQESVIRSRDNLAQFRCELGVTEGMASELWTVTDQMNKKVATLFDFAAAVGEKVNQNETAHAALEQEKEALEWKIEHISLEEQSYQYYLCQETLDACTEALKRAEEENTAAIAESETAERRYLLLECARYYRDLVEITSKISALDEAIRAKETDSGVNERIASLRYSAACAIRAELSSVDELLARLQVDREQVSTSLSDTEKDCADLHSLVESLATETSRLEGTLKAEMTQADWLVGTLEIPAIRMLDQTYANADLTAWVEKQGVKRSELASQKSEAEEALSRMDGRKAEIVVQVERAKVHVRDSEREKSEIEASIAEYDTAETKLASIFARYGMDFQSRFEVSSNDHMATLLSQTRGNIQRTERAAEGIEEELLSARNGTLHIPKLVSAFLEESGIQYIGVEQYLLGQLRDHNLSAEQCAALLSSSPYAAYGIILLGDPDNAMSALSELANEGRWLPSVLPIFTMADMEKMLRGQAGELSVFAAYARDYFADNAGYVASKESQLEETKRRLSMYQEGYSQLEQDMQELEAFARYGVNWKSNTVAAKEAKEKEAAGYRNQIKALQQEAETLAQRIPVEKEIISQCEDDIKTIDQQFKDYDRLLNLLDEESEHRSGLSEKNSALASKRAEQADAKRRVDSLTADLNRLNGKYQDNAQKREELSDNYLLVQDSDESPVINGDWRALMAELEQLQGAQSKEIESLHSERKIYDEHRKEKEKELTRRGCEENDYRDLPYTEAAEKAAYDAKEDAKCRMSAAQERRDTANTAYIRADADFRHAENDLHSIAQDPLPKNEIGSEFDTRKRTAKQKISEVNRAIKENEAIGRKIERLKDRADSASKAYLSPIVVKPFVLDDDLKQQLEGIIAAIASAEKAVGVARRRITDQLEDLRRKYEDSLDEARLCLSNFRDLLNNDTASDSLYTLFEQIGAVIQTTEKRISQIDTDLAEFEHFENDLIQQCLIQGKKLYDGLKQISDKSRVRIQGTRRPMIRFDLPKDISEAEARDTIREAIEKGRKEVSDALSGGNDLESSAVNRILNATVSDANLLRKYIGKTSISVEAFKIDQNPENSTYRDWNSRSDSSGAERFVVCFALILALLAYARDSIEDIGAKSSVVIMDNPFGEISSKHVLEPMFEIAKTYHVQLICLSDISKSDVVCCFDVLIRAIVKSSAFSKTEQLVHEQEAERERVEHAHVREEQTSLF